MLVLVLFSSCSEKEKNISEENIQTISKIEFQSIIDTSNVKGAILIFDSKEKIYYSNDFKWCKTGKLPASTFKIPNSIIALETKVVKDDSFIFKWNGEERALKNWEQDLNFKEAFHFSCVPCYQEIARKVGLERMKEYIKKLDYGQIIVDSNSIDNFWLVGQSTINQFQQIDFLRRFYQSELPIQKRTERVMKELMVIEGEEAYKLSGKTGWSINGSINNGWFVGYIETAGKVYYFATNVEPKNTFSMEEFPSVRKAVTYAALKEMKIIH